MFQEEGSPVRAGKTQGRPEALIVLTHIGLLQARKSAPKAGSEEAAAAEAEAAKQLARVTYQARRFALPEGLLTGPAAGGTLALATSAPIHNILSQHARAMQA